MEGFFFALRRVYSFWLLLNLLYLDYLAFLPKTIRTNNPHRQISAELFVGYFSLAVLLCGTFIYLQATQPAEKPVNDEKVTTQQIETPAKTVSLETDAAEKVNSLPTFKESSHNFGEVAKGTPVSHTFKFVNEGSEDLLIEKVKPACGCTSEDYSKEAIAPGESGYVTLTYNAAKPGVFNKSASVMSNSKDAPMLVLSFKGEVVEK